jgi:hypothetical protein
MCSVKTPAHAEGSRHFQERELCLCGWASVLGQLLDTSEIITLALETLGKVWQSALMRPNGHMYSSHYYYSWVIFQCHRERIPNGNDLSDGLTLV